MTAPAGAASAADVSGSSPAAMNTTSAQEAFLESLDTPEAVELPTLPDDASPSTDVDAKAESTAEPEAGKGKVPEAVEPPPIPFAAFQKRLGRETEKTQVARGEAQAARLDSLRLKSALDLVHADYEVLKDALLQAGVDPRDMQLRQHQLLAEATRRDASVSAEHQQALAEAQKAATHEHWKSVVREEIASAAKANPLVSVAELRQAMADSENLDAAAVALSLQAAKLDIARRHLPQKPAHPRTARAGGAGTMPRIDTSTRGLEDLLERIQAEG